MFNSVKEEVGPREFITFPGYFCEFVTFLYGSASKIVDPNFAAGSVSDPDPDWIRIL